MSQVNEEKKTATHVLFPIETWVMIDKFIEASPFGRVEGLVLEIRKNIRLVDMDAVSKTGGPMASERTEAKSKKGTACRKITKD